MFNTKHEISLITAVLPTTAADTVVSTLTSREVTDVLVSQARGTLLRDHWWKSWVPPISPSKTMLQMVVPAHDVERVVGLVIEEVNPAGHSQLKVAQVVVDDPFKLTLVILQLISPPLALILGRAMSSSTVTETTVSHPPASATVTV